MPFDMFSYVALGSLGAFVDGPRIVLARCGMQEISGDAGEVKCLLLLPLPLEDVGGEHSRVEVSGRLGRVLA